MNKKVYSNHTEIRLLDFQSKEDLDNLLNLIIGLQNFEKTLEARRLEPHSMANKYLADMLEEHRKNSGAILLAKHSGQTVGFISILFEEELDPALNYQTKIAYVSDLMVDEKFRRLKIAALLMNKAEELAQEHGVEAIKVEMLANNHGAELFYKNAGFAIYELVLLKSLRTMP